MVIKNVSLDIVCGITSKIPDTGRPEVAFAGKSNVGKSSLINGLTVSYTHLDVYKRQVAGRIWLCTGRKSVSCLKRRHRAGAWLV